MGGASGTMGYLYLLRLEGLGGLPDFTGWGS
jgi:hypothetical protein